MILDTHFIYDDRKGHFHLIWKVIASEFNINVYSKALEEVWKAKRFQMGELGKNELEHFEFDQKMRFRSRISSFIEHQMS
jgi:hypothetical protein